MKLYLTLKQEGEKSIGYLKYNSINKKLIKLEPDTTLFDIVVNGNSFYKISIYTYSDLHGIV